MSVIVRDPAARPGRLRPGLWAGRHLLLTMPWTSAVAFGAVGAAMTYSISLLAGPSQSPAVLLASMRAGLAVATLGLCFLFADPAPLLTETLPARPWTLRAMRVVLALPIVAVSGLAQVSAGLRALATDDPPGISLPRAAAWGGFGIELAAFCALALLAAALVARSRRRELGGALAAPLALLVIAALAAVPHHVDVYPSGYLVDPSALGQAAWAGAERAWAVVCAVALAGAAWGSRDLWSRLRRPRRPRNLPTQVR